jgi:phage terminase small subunit
VALNEKQRKACRELITGCTQEEAYVRAGYAKAAAKSGASKLFSRPEAQQYLNELRKPVVEKAQITAQMVLEELAKIGFANIADFVKATPGGDPYIDLSKMTREQAAALSEITIDDYMDGRGEDAREVKRVRVKLADKRAALCDIGKHLGMFRENPGGEEAPMPTRVVIEVVDGRKSDGD